ncbi:MAG: toxin-antitoxin (TA) system antitoxin [Candidatus Riflebacteria bacterium]|nr:toxin-antitoxin (TA) system antitoxin [Candidatus Riflebacteria bacterium]
MSTQTVSVQDAQKRLAELIDLAKQGDEIVIAQDEQTRVRLVPFTSHSAPRILGQYHGKIMMSRDFDDPLPDEFWLGENP